MAWKALWKGMFSTGFVRFTLNMFLCKSISNVQSRRTSSWSWYSCRTSRPHRSGSHLTAISLSISSTSMASSAQRCTHCSTRTHTMACWETRRTWIVPGITNAYAYTKCFLARSALTQTLKSWSDIIHFRFYTPWWAVPGCSGHVTANGPALEPYRWAFPQLLWVPSQGFRWLPSGARHHVRSPVNPEETVQSPVHCTAAAGKHSNKE